VKPWIHYKRLQDDEFCDEIRLKVIPRFKTSGLSGNEWRTGVRIELLRKGRVYAADGFSKIHFAMLMFGSFFLKAHEPVPEEQLKYDESLCDQPGCKDGAVNHYKLKQEFADDVAKPIPEDMEIRRKFCARHSVRGDQSYEDSDANYVLIKGTGEGKPHPSDISESQTIVLGSK